MGSCVETFGDRSDSAIYLIMGTRASMEWWEDEFCQRLAAGSRFVIRYDQRDTGRSVSYEPGAPQYTLRDLAADAIPRLVPRRDLLFAAVCRFHAASERRRRRRRPWC